jgi:protein-tyrosine phosphatase
MGLDYSQGCVNFRDVGEFVNLIAGRALLPERRLLRGGKIDFVGCAEEVASPGTILNLRGGPDALDFGADLYHFPMANTYEKYDTSQREVRRWLNTIIAVFEKEDLRYPVLIHCLSGKDRTGIVVAALLRILDIPEDIIVEEYLLSEGEVAEERIRQALAGIGEPADYFDRVNLERVRYNITAA